MPHYLIQVAYNSDGVAALVKEPQDRIEKVRPAVEGLGGSIECAYYAFGEHDIVLIVEMPANTQAAAMALAVGAAGDEGGRPVGLQARHGLNSRNSGAAGGMGTTTVGGCVADGGAEAICVRWTLLLRGKMQQRLASLRGIVARRAGGVIR